MSAKKKQVYRPVNMTTVIVTIASEKLFVL
jgi:hypothetical protein